MEKDKVLLLCPGCNYKTTQSWNLKTHLKSRDGKCMKYCNVSTQKYSRNRVKKVKEANAVCYQCNRCSEVFKKKVQLKHHQIVKCNSFIKRYCKHCANYFSENVVTSHIRKCKRKTIILQARRNRLNGTD